ncbi:TetR family transcriptional regulator [Streptomyces brevispora]|uniref:TetR family transcriptional regulator n=1 Tax=Streptomyces brevispora TaxID=887462 RepID=A0A561UZ36_9ACTN|nr:helix-turn-helix domain-containing protein [Streptomyces brevispora]TWG04594.1 TetR family transcriptional regulator [Streptomyces brevispora]
MHIQETHWPAAAVTSEANGRISTLGAGGAGGAVGTANGAGSSGATASSGTVSTLGAALGSAAVGAVGAAGGVGAVGGAAHGRSAPLRVDAQRNLEHVLRAAREVFGELGYGAPMEDVARRARVGVGTVYRRFPSKDVLVRRIAEEETSRLTDQARSALGQEEEPWSALSRFLRTSVASGAGRLLPPQILRVGVNTDDSTVVGDPGAVRATEPAGAAGQGSAGDGRGEPRVPQQRQEAVQSGPRASEPRSVPESEIDDIGSGAAELLEVVGRLVDRARTSGELRRDVTVADVLLVIATAAPSLPDAAQQAAASARLLDILLEGLRSRPA